MWPNIEDMNVRVFPIGVEVVRCAGISLVDNLRCLSPLSSSAYNMSRHEICFLSLSHVVVAGREHNFYPNCLPFSCKTLTDHKL